MLIPLNICVLWAKKTIMDKNGKLEKDKTQQWSELIVRFMGLVILYFIGVFWNGLFMREGTGTLGWIIYFIGGGILFVYFCKLTFNCFKRFIGLLKKN